MLTHERLLELLTYDKLTGHFTWNVIRGPARAGSRAGTLHHLGYIRIDIDGKKYMASRLAWLYVTGKWPSDNIDHINRKRDDNRYVNLRLATGSQNQGNVGLRKNNTSGFPGVCWYKRKKKYRVQMWENGKRKSLGYFSTAEEAYKVYAERHRLKFGEFSNV